MRRYLPLTLILALIAAAIGLYYFNQFWIHRYDAIIERHAKVYSLDEKLVWSVIYEETYFRAWKKGAAEEIGLMQVTPAVAREWARETGFREFEKQTAQNLNEFLSDPERNIQVGCWYLETLREKYRNYPAQNAMMLAAYNAGPSRVEEWTREVDKATVSEIVFIERINIASTKAYVTSILERYREVKLKEK